jgi:deoxyribose-phosphate aldolase
MKFYSEKTKELYDSVEALEAAEKSLHNFNKINELVDVLADKQVEVLKVATEIAKLTNKPFYVPEMAAMPDGKPKLKSSTGKKAEITSDGMVTTDFSADINKAETTPKTDAIKSSTKSKVDNKTEPKLFEEKFGITRDKAVNKEDEKAIMNFLNSLKFF